MGTPSPRIPCGLFLFAPPSALDLGEPDHSWGHTLSVSFISGDSWKVLNEASKESENKDRGEAENDR